MNLLSVRNLVKRYGGLLATDHFNMSVETGETHAVIGPNGAGKSTLIAQLSGESRPSEGSILFDGKDITQVRFIGVPAWDWPAPIKSLPYSMNSPHCRTSCWQPKRSLGTAFDSGLP